jgi:hypothetical protein
MPTPQRHHVKKSPGAHVPVREEKLTASLTVLLMQMPICEVPAALCDTIKLLVSLIRTC